MDDGTPALEVGFAIDMGGSFESLTRLDSLIDRATADAVADFARVERASKGMLDLGGATATIQSFGSASTRELQDIRREMAATEKVGEGLVRQLEREAAAFGKTKAEMREAKVEAVALAAAQQGNTDLADRLLSASRQRQFAAEAAAEAEAAAANQRAVEAARQASAAEASVIAQLRERAQLEQAIGRINGADRPRAVDAGATFSALSAKAAEDEARALDASAAAAQRAAREHAELAAMVQGSHAAQLADAEAAERLRMSTDPLYAATKRLNAEIAESTRLYHVGATAPAEYARQQQVLSERLNATAQQHEAAATAGTKNAHAMKMVAVQAPDIIQGLLTGQKPMQVFIQQGGQIAQIAMMAEGGVKGFAKEVALLSLRFAPLAVVAGLAWGAIKLFQGEVKDSKELTHYRDSLGLTHKEMLKLSDGADTAGGKIKTLGDVTVTTGDVMSGLWKTIQDTAKPPAGDWSGFSKGATDAFHKVTDAWGVVSAGITAGIYGTVNAAKVIWKNFAESVGDIFYQAANLAIEGMNKLVRGATSILNGFIHGANKIPGIDIGDVAAPQVAAFANPYAGASSRDAAAGAAKAITDGFHHAYADAKKADAAFWAQVGKNAKQSAKDRMSEEAAAIKANRTPHKPKVDHHAEQLARDAAAVEAQIKNLYALADAYGVSGAAALIAEARVKAESDAIKKRGDIEAMVARQVRLAVAQRVVDSAKATAAMLDQAAVQRAVTAEVAAGNVPAERAAELMRDRMADLPMLAALQAAQQVGDQKGAERAEVALDKQRAARVQLTDAERDAWLVAQKSDAANRLAEMQEELRLVGATDAARAHALAVLKATQEAAAKGAGGQNAVDYIDQQVALADTQFQVQIRTKAANDNLSYQADLLDLIAGNAQRAGQGIADAFGDAGRAIGELTSDFAAYLADQARLKQVHADQLKDIATIKDAEVRTQRESQVNTMFALRSGAAQVGLYGDMAAAAKGFFSEKSKGYQAMLAAEKVFRAFEFAMSVRSMVQDMAETISSVANSGARATAEGAEGVAQQSKLPFPFNIAAMAATGAALVAAGIAVLGSGGGHASAPDPGNTGTGTVLGNPTAQSESIKRSIDALNQVDTLMLSSSRQMAASLRSIDQQIGGFAAQILKAGDINANAGVTQGFKANAIGSVLGNVPLIGGILKGLFGSTTTVTGSGLYGGAQSLGSILNGGFDASYYSDIQKKSKFLGITTGTKTSTQFTGADAALENQFTLILRSFDDAIKAAAGPLGESTDAIQQRLNGFVVNIGKINLTGLTGDQITEKLTAVFGAAADQMASGAFPAITRFQRAGEGEFETLVRVSSTVEAVTAALGELGAGARALSIDAKLGLADQFDSVSALTDATGAYFQAFYSQEEQAAAKTAQLGNVFASLGLTMPGSLAGFRQLVEAQDLTTAAGQATYATLLKLAPAFADLQTAMEGAKSATDIASERADLQRQLLELQGNTAAIRELDLAKLDGSNRALQQQIWAIQDGQAAAKAADELRQAWQSVGDSIMDEVKRIRGLTDTASGGGFASLLGQFNVATAAARGGDQDAAKSLPGLSQALLTAATDAATSRQELDRVRAQTAASLEATYGVIGALAGNAAAGNAAAGTSGLLAAAATASQPAAAATPINDDLVEEVRGLRAEMVELRKDNNAGHAATAGNTNKIDRRLQDVTAASGGTAVSVAA